MIYLVSYSPLANSKAGRAVAAQHSIPLYVDASCRREPDFELAEPFVSGLCRPNFVATLKPGDVLVYITNKRPIHSDGRRLPAILKLKGQFVSHQSAADEYKAKGHRIPSSCVVPGNAPVPIEMTDPKMNRRTQVFTDSNVWSRAVYSPRANRCTRCFSSDPLFLELLTPPKIRDDFWIQWFGSDPGSSLQNGGRPLAEPALDALLHHAGIKLNGSGNSN